MYNIIKRYVENENQNGLLLIDMPTGSGKTYSAVEFIYDSCMSPDNKDRKYIFVTTLRINLLCFASFYPVLRKISGRRPNQDFADWCLNILRKITEQWKREFMP